MKSEFPLDKIRPIKRRLENSFVGGGEGKKGGGNAFTHGAGKKPRNVLQRSMHWTGNEKKKN